MSPPLSPLTAELCNSFPEPPTQRNTSSSSQTLRPVVGIPATETEEEVVDGCVVEDPRSAALQLINEKFRLCTTFRARSRQYMIEAKLGEGLSSVTFQVEDCKENRYVALKLVPLSEAYKDETYSTAALLHRLTHQHIVPCHDFFEYATGGVSFLCLKLPFCSRGSLGDLIRHKNHLGSKVSARHICGYISQLASALQCLHQQELLHGDLRPEHVLLHPFKEEVRLIGLTDGVGLRRRSKGPVTVTGGRGLYAPPEWAQSHFLGRRLHPQETPLPSYDMWTLGCLLVELCTGRTLEDRLGPHGPSLAASPAAMQAVRVQMQSAHKGVFEPLSRGLLDPDPDTRLTPEGVQELLREIKAKKSSFSGTFSKPFQLLKLSTRA
eukprot:EG_transcript_8762